MSGAVRDPAGFGRAPSWCGLAGLAFAAATAAPAMAQLSGPDACYQRSYDAAHLAAHPSQGVAALRLMFLDEYRGEPDSRMVIVQALMADQGQGRRDGVGGMTLQSTLYCRDDPGPGPACFVDCDGGSIGLEALPDGGLMVSTEFAAIGRIQTCGAASDLSEGGPTRYRLAAAPPDICADLARPHPLPGPGCYGVTYPHADAVGVVAALTLWLAHPDLSGREPRFPWLEGTLAVDVAAAARRLDDPAAARVLLPLWCSSESGNCRAGAEELAGILAIAPEGEAVSLETGHFLIQVAGETPVDITDGGLRRHALQPLPAEACTPLVPA